MKPGIPWSIKGIEPELREVAKTAARRSGMTLGEWLNTAINERADTPADELAVLHSATKSHSVHSTHPIERAASRLEDIAEQLARISSRESDTAHRPSRDPDEQFAFAKVLSRVESNEKQTVEAFSAVNERLATISRQITRSQPTKMEESPGFQAMEKAVRNIVEHLEVADKRTRDNMKSLQDRMGDMAQRVSTSTSEQLLRQAPAFNQLEQRLSDLAKRVDQPPQHQPSDQLRHEINALAGRIDNVRETSETLATRAQTQAVQTAQAELRAIEDRIIGLINEAKQTISVNKVGPAELQRFRQEIDKINARVDSTAAAPNNSHDVNALKVAVEQLSTRVAQGQDQRPFADLDAKIFAIAKKLEQAEAASKSLPQANDLDRRFAELDQKLMQSLANPSQNNDAIAQKLMEVDERLGRTEHQLGHLQTIERAISQLYDSMEGLRGQTHDIAHAAATKAVEQIDPNALARPQPYAASDEIMALETGLKAVRAASEASDHRNQETLEAVHETLEQIVSKLTELETAHIGHRLSQAAAPALYEPQPMPSHVEPVAPAAPLHEPVAPFLSAAPSGFDHQPALGMPHEVENAAVESPAVDGGIGDIVAAARRLHQAAQIGKNNLGATSAGARPTKPVKKAFSIPFLTARSGKTVQPPISVTAPLVVDGGEVGQRALFAGLKAAQANEGSRKRLIVVGALLFALALVGIRGLQGRINQVPEVAPATIEQMAPKAIAPVLSITPQIGQPETAPLVAPEVKTKGNVNPAQQGEVESITPPSDPIMTGAISSTTMASPIPEETISVASATAAPNTVLIEAALGPAKLRQAADRGDVTAQYVVATHYLEGDTVSSDFAKAAYWYGKSASGGSAPAQYRLASLYERGKGVPKNLSSALSWYEKSASLGNVKAMHNAAVIAASNDVGQPDYAKAFRYFSLAASHGLKDSQYNLAVLIERGMGTAADSNDALFWFMAAAAQGDPEAKIKVESLSKTVKPTILDSVKTRFKNWSPEKAPEAANTVNATDALWNPGKAASLTPGPQANINDQTKALLEKLGYGVGAYDGSLDIRTAGAVRLYQLKQGMKVTGIITPELVESMRSQAS